MSTNVEIVATLRQALEAFDALQSHGDIAVLVTPEREFNFAQISKQLRQAISDAEKQTSCYCPNCEALSKQLEELKAKNERKEKNT